MEELALDSEPWPSNDKEHGNDIKCSVLSPAGSLVELVDKTGAKSNIGS